MSDLADAVFGRGKYKPSPIPGLDPRLDPFYDSIDDPLYNPIGLDDIYDPLRGGQYDNMRGDYDPSYVSTGSNYKASSSGPSSSSMPGPGQSPPPPPPKTPKNTSASSPSRPPRNRNHAMLIAMAGLAPIAGLAIGGMLGNKSQEETKAQQLAQMKYM